MSVYKVDFSVANGIWVEDRLRTDMTVWFSWSASSHPAYVHPSIHGVCKSLRPSTIYQPLYWFYLNITFHHFSLINCLPLPNEINQEFHKYSARSALMDVFFFFAFFFQFPFSDKNLNTPYWSFARNAQYHWLISSELNASYQEMRFGFSLPQRII